jgi:DNA-binding protein HU-beta
MTDLNEGNFIDGMIWIGKSYKKILCREKGSCGIPVKNKRNKCYVHEAEWRGCCRKVPDKPGWLAPGRSKIFLAHKNNLKPKEQGKIFGYFVLERIEMLQPPQKVMPLEVNPTSPMQIKKLENLQRENKKILSLNGTVYRADNGKPINGAVIETEPMKGDGKEKTITGKNGTYRMELEAGRYRITVSAQGFETETLEGLEMFLDEKIKQDFYLTPRICSEGQELKRICWNGKEIVTHQCKDGEWAATGEKCPEPPDPKEKPSKCKNGRELIQECWDGSKIVTHRCENGTWIATDEECPPLPEPQRCKEGAEIKKTCWNGQVITLYRCDDGEWIPTGETCPGKADGPDRPDKPDIPKDPIPVPIDITIFETHRSCSLRFKPGGIYLVDALTADVTDTFSSELRKTDTWKNYKKAKNNAERKAYIEEGNELFKEILRRFRETRKAKTKIPSSLLDKVELRGELVLFKDPPIFKNHPRASFRGVRRIDGDQLLQQIAAGVPVPGIPYYTTGDSTQREMIINEIAETFKINQATSQRILKKFIDIFSNELKEECKLRIPDFGTFKVVRTSARKGINPRTGEEIDIPARNTVRFKPAKALKETVKESSPDNSHEEKKS